MDEAHDPGAPGFFFTPLDPPWDRVYYAGKESTKYYPMWAGVLQGAGIHSEVSKTRPMTGGSANCPQSDSFWTDYSALREVFLDTAYAHLAPPEDEDSESSGDEGGVFAFTDHFGGATRAIP